MTKKHFELLAKAIADTYKETFSELDDAEFLRKALLNNIGDACLLSNSRFQRSKFEAKINALVNS